MPVSALFKKICKRCSCAPDAREEYTQIFIRDYRLPVSIGVHDWEKRQKQDVCVTLYADLFEGHKAKEDDIAVTLSYSNLVQGIRSVANQGHYELVETLAARIASMCLEYRLVRRVQVSVSKPEIYKDIDAVGATITRSQITT